MSPTTEVVQDVRDWSKASEEELRRGYEEMAADTERESEALEWSEALIGDGFAPLVTSIGSTLSRQSAVKSKR